MKAVELFAGAGGLGLGVSMAGFDPVAVIEWDRWACDTIRENQQRGFSLVENWPLHEMDVRQFDLSSVPEGIELVTGGPPCQPFSMGGKHQAFLDSRDMFPATIETVRRLKPKAFIVENVKGLTRSAFSNYLSYIVLQLTYPEVVQKKNETWLDHLGRLEKVKTSGKRSGLTYEVVVRLLNAANYGVPQKRERVFIVGFRSDLGARWSFPEQTHSLDALLLDQWVSGGYWERHKVAKSKRPSSPTGPVLRKLERLRAAGTAIGQPWRTVRDAIGDLPDPRRMSGGHLNHKFQPGARPYPGHTGSPLDLPAKTLKAGDHGVPGGENMLVMPSGETRYFSVRESARLQTFPDGYIFHGAWSETMRQLGNAVPMALAQQVASSVAEQLLRMEERNMVAAMSREHSQRAVA
jgi:DNA (cytosine-5)-methyltransferase 1